MTVNTFVLSGEVKRIDVNKKTTPNGPAAVLMVQYGPSRAKTDKSVQFLNLALVRVPPYVYAKHEGKIKKGCLVDLVGHVQGVLKQVMNDAFVSNELVNDRLQIVEFGEEDPVQAPQEAAAAATPEAPKESES